MKCAVVLILATISQIVHGLCESKADFKASVHLSELALNRRSSFIPASSGAFSGFNSSGFVALRDTLDVIPPDSNGAVSHGFVVTALNSQVRIQKKNGDEVLTLSLGAFWSALENPIPFDPRTLFDPVERRWIMVAAADRVGRSSLLVGVSATENPDRTWYLYRIVGNTGTGAYMDYPAVGFNRDSIIVSCLIRTNVGNHLFQTRTYYFNKQDLYTNGPGRNIVATHHPLYLPVPAVAINETDPPLLLSVPIRTNEPIREMQVLTFQAHNGTGSLTVLNVFSNLPPWAAVAPDNGNLAPQLGSPQRIHLHDSVIANVVQKGSVLWFSQMVFLASGAPTRAAVQWGRLTVSNLVTFARIEDPTGERSYGYPSIAINELDQVCIGFTRFSNTEYPSAACAIIPTLTAPEQFIEVLLKAGEGPYVRTLGTSKNRWGDYSSTQVDPSDGLGFWTIQEYAAKPEGDPPNDGTGRWSTWWANVRISQERAAVITSIEANSTVILTISAEPGFKYILESTDLLFSEWSFLKEFDGNAQIRIEDSRPAERQRFYRVRAVVQ